jgi:mannitol 2-dehydrogenase
MAPPALSRQTLPSLSADVAVGTYTPGDVTPGIVHFGVGGFHRAHQAVVVDDLMSREWPSAGG